MEHDGNVSDYSMDSFGFERPTKVAVRMRNISKPPYHAPLTTTGVALLLSVAAVVTSRLHFVHALFAYELHLELQHLQLLLEEFGAERRYFLHKFRSIVDDAIVIDFQETDDRLEVFDSVLGARRLLVELR